MCGLIIACNNMTHNFTFKDFNKFSIIKKWELIFIYHFYNNVKMSYLMGLLSFTLGGDLFKNTKVPYLGGMQWESLQRFILHQEGAYQWLEGREAIWSVLLRRLSSAAGGNQTHHRYSEIHLVC